MMNSEQYFNLYSCCIPVKGFTKAVICDLQRDTFDFIPLGLYEILTDLVKKNRNLQQIKNYFHTDEHETIDEYFDFLIKKEYGFLSDKYHNLPEINLAKYNEPRFITNSIVDFSLESKHNIKLIIPQLSELLCEALEIRFFYSISLSTMCDIISHTENSTIRDVEILTKYNNEYSIDNVLDLRKSYKRLRKITLYSAPFNKFYEHQEIVIIFTQNEISSEAHCGVITPWYFISKTEVFVEAQNYNSCLNRKICIDKEGQIKNCPSMNISFGNISSTPIKDIIRNPEFCSIWRINKDQIEVCKDCELRYICQDCRAYLCDPTNPYSKPLKCNYNPYE